MVKPVNFFFQGHNNLLVGKEIYFWSQKRKTLKNNNKDIVSNLTNHNISHNSLTFLNFRYLISTGEVVITFSQGFVNI